MGYLIGNYLAISSVHLPTLTLGTYSLLFLSFLSYLINEIFGAPPPPPRAESKWLSL